MITSLSSIILAASLSMTGQYRVVKTFWTVPPEVKDMAFTQIQVDWVYQQRKNAIYSWESVLPQEEADLLDALVAEKFSVRRFARRHLNKMGFKAASLCAWGMNAKSDELRQVCSTHLYSLYTCTYCNGSGMIDLDDGNTRYVSFCRGCRENTSCKNGGSFYWYEKYHPVDPNRWMLRNLFGRTIDRNDKKDEDINIMDGGGN